MPPSKGENDSFLTGLKQLIPSASILSSMTVLQRSAPRSRVVRKLPAPLISLHKPEYTDLVGEELEKVCQDVFCQLKVTCEESTYLEECTRLQSHCDLWHQHRAGQITSSLFKRVKNASIAKPSASLIETLLLKSRFNSSKVPALHWGITHEDTARKEYVELASEYHVNFECCDSGLHVNPKFPHLGATPDGVTNCDCCGNGLLEIKCPYKHRNEHPHKVQDPTFYLKKDDGEIHLPTDHEYYFQVQGQLAVCEMDYCDFVCWTPCGLHCERILVDTNFFEQVKPSLDKFFISVLLPRLLTGSTSTSSAVTKQVSVRPQNTYCWCDGKDEGKMVACDNGSCEREWFHYQCVGISRKPRGKWFCSDNCRKADMLANAS